MSRSDATSDEVILVDRNDAVVGRADKLLAHRPPGLLHRAFSVFVHDGAGRVLLQQRAATKYHFAGLWSNACCSHPRVGEPVLAAAHRRLREELGLVARDATVLGRFEYHAIDRASGLVEWEIDHVVLTAAEGTPMPDPAEVAAFEWVAVDDLLMQLQTGDRAMTPWFAPAFDLVLSSSSLFTASAP